MTFIIHFKDKPRKTYNSRYNENIEHEILGDFQHKCEHKVD